MKRADEFQARATRTFGGATTTFKRDGADPVDAVLSDITGSTTARYLPGISEQRNGVSTYFHEGIKNAITQTNASQTVTATKRYNAFGLQSSSTGAWKSPFVYGGPWGYQEDGDASGLKLLGHRYYDPGTGRFLSRDIASLRSGNVSGLIDCANRQFEVIVAGRQVRPPSSNPPRGRLVYVIVPQARDAPQHVIVQIANLEDYRNRVDVGARIGRDELPAHRHF